jgi:uncharacterized membrane protein YedE/YeeE
MIEYWSWWKGALALGGTTVVFVLLLDRMLGVSGSWAVIVNWREERKRQKLAAGFKTHAAAVENVLLAATLAEFGEQKTSQAFAQQALPSSAPPMARVPLLNTRWTTHVTFLLSLLVGGFLAALSHGQFEWRLDLGQAHTQLFGSHWQEWLTLMLGGMLVGFGTQMGGGCTSGHGLSGVSRLEPASLVATTMFFGSAVAISFLMEALTK